MFFHKFGWIIRDEKNRQLFPKFELRKKVLKSLLGSSNLSSLYKIYFIKKLITFNKNSSRSLYRTFDVFSHLGRSVFRRFKLNRHFAKKFASLGFLIGMRKSSF